MTLFALKLAKTYYFPIILKRRLKKKKSQKSNPIDLNITFEGPKTQKQNLKIAENVFEKENSSSELEENHKKNLVTICEFSKDQSKKTDKNYGKKYSESNKDEQMKKDPNNKSDRRTSTSNFSGNSSSSQSALKKLPKMTIPGKKRTQMNPQSCLLINLISKLKILPQIVLEKVVILKLYLRKKSRIVPKQNKKKRKKMILEKWLFYNLNQLNNQNSKRYKISQKKKN